MITFSYDKDTASAQMIGKCKVSERPVHSLAFKGKTASSGLPFLLVNCCDSSVKLYW